VPTEELRVLALDQSQSMQVTSSNYYLSQPNKVLNEVRHVA